MNETLKWALIAGAGYLVYVYLRDQGLVGGVIPAVGEGTEGNGVTNGEAAGGGAASPTKESLHQYALQRQPSEWDGKLNADQWNYYYTAASGIQQTTELHPAGDRGYLMTVDEYFTARASKGLSGMNGRVSPLVWVV